MNLDDTISKKERLLLKSTGKKPSFERPILKGLKIVSEKEIYKLKKKNSEVKLTLVKTEDNQKLVLKQVIFEGQDKELWKELNREYYVGKMFNIILGNSPRLLRCLKKGTDGSNFHSFETLMEYRGKPLTKIKFTKKQLQEITFQLLKILSKMEALGIAHLDLKPANILWDEKTQKIFLIDFGSSIIFYKEKHRVFEPLMEYAYLIRHCTYRYAPPEILKGKRTQLIPVKVDVFCFGITLAELLIINNKKHMLFSRKNSKEGIQQFTEEICNLLGDQHQFIKLFKDCVHHDPEQRSTFSTLFHQFCTMFKVEKPIEKKSVEEYIQLANKYLKKGEIEIGEYFSDIAIEIMKDDPKNFENKINLEIQLISSCLNRLDKEGVEKYSRDIDSIDLSYFNPRTRIKILVLILRNNFIFNGIDDATRLCLKFMNRLHFKLDEFCINSTYTISDYMKLQLIVLKQLDYTFESKQIALNILDKLCDYFENCSIRPQIHFFKLKKALERYFCPAHQNIPIKFHICMGKE